MNYKNNLQEWVEVDEADDLGDGYVECPSLAFDPDDYNYIQVHGTPYIGMYALGSNGDLYQYTAVPRADIGLGELGGLRKFFRKLKKKAKRAAKKIKKKITKTKFGKAVIKVAKKFKPIAKKLGPWMKKLAPMAKAIPGIGPVVSKAMMATGKIGDAMKKYGAAAKVVKAVARKSGNISDLVKIAIPKQNAAKFRNEIYKQAQSMKKKSPYELRKMASMLDRTPVNSAVAQRMMPVAPPSKASRHAAVKVARLIKKENALNYAKNKRNPLFQRRRAMAHARKLAAENMRSIRRAAAQEGGGKGPANNALRVMQKGAQKQQIQRQIAILRRKLSAMEA